YRGSTGAPPAAWQGPGIEELQTAANPLNSGRCVFKPAEPALTFDVNKHIEPKYILSVMQKYPALFADLQPIPADVAIKPGYTFKP
ncbi:hypothetical protein, partial [Piscinibacter koreensis]|uniref:hypothetical protein n=1 Tax=Piscinibacter koreensis TaxID=2742824 RepID=UPI001C37A3B2